MVGILLAGAVATGYSAWKWKQWSRPGVRHSLAGVEAVNAHTFSKAEQEWLQGVREDPDFPDCYTQLGDLYTALHRPSEAARYYSTATRLTPGDGTLWVKLGNSHRAVGDKPGAYQAYKKAAALLPDDAEAQGEYGIFANRMKDNNAAVQALRRANKLSPNDPRYTLALVAVESDADDYSAAESHLAPYLRLHPNDTQANYFMAVIENQKTRTPENLRSAIMHAERAQPAMRDDRRIYYLLGRFYLDSNQPAKALRAYQRGQQIEPFNETLYSGLMQCYAVLGDEAKRRQTAARLQYVVAHERRREYLRHELGFHHKNVDAALELAHLWEEEGKYETAASTLKFATQQSPGDVRVQRAAQGFIQRMQVRQARPSTGNGARLPLPALPLPKPPLSSQP